MYQTHHILELISSDSPHRKNCQSSRVSFLSRFLLTNKSNVCTGMNVQSKLMTPGTSNQSKADDDVLMKLKAWYKCWFCNEPPIPAYSLGCCSALYCGKCLKFHIELSLRHKDDLMCNLCARDFKDKTCGDRTRDVDNHCLRFPNMFEGYLCETICGFKTCKKMLSLYELLPHLKTHGVNDFGFTTTSPSGLFRFFGDIRRGILKTLNMQKYNPELDVIFDSDIFKTEDYLREIQRRDEMRKVCDMNPTGRSVVQRARIKSSKNRKRRYERKTTTVDVCISSEDEVPEKRLVISLVSSDENDNACTADIRVIEVDGKKIDGVENNIVGPKIERVVKEETVDPKSASTSVENHEPSELSDDDDLGEDIGSSSPISTDMSHDSDGNSFIDDSELEFIREGADSLSAYADDSDE